MFKWVKKLFKKKISFDNWATIQFKCAQYTVIQLPNDHWTVEIMLFFDDLKDIVSPEQSKGLRLYMFGLVRDTPVQIINELAAMGRLFKETNTVVNVVDKNNNFVVAYDISHVQKILQEKFNPPVLKKNNETKQIISEGNSSIH